MLNRLNGLQGFSIQGATPVQVAAVINGFGCAVRDLKTKEDVAVLALEIQRVGAAYGARKDIPDLVLREIVALVRSKFSMLGVSEIGESFRMAASGELKANSEMYGGELNAKIIGSVLGRYLDWRRGVIAGLIKREDRILKMQNNAEKHEKGRLEFEASLPGLIADARFHGKFKSWEMVPEFWYSAAVRIGLVVPEKGKADEVVGVAESIMKREQTPINKLVLRKKVLCWKLYLWRYVFEGEFPDFKAV